MNKETLMLHQPHVELEPGNTPMISPIYYSVKYLFNSWGDLEKSRSGGGEGFYYSRSSNPTVRQLELVLAQLQDREDAVAVGSGMAAISVCLLALLSAGDHLLYCVESYRPTRILIRETLSKLGISSSMVSMQNLADVEKEMIATKPKVILFESVSNPLNCIADIEEICTLAKKYNVTTVCDNTIAGLHVHGQYEVDYFLHSLTKFAGGHSDAMGGVIVAEKEMLKAVRAKRYIIGCNLDPHSASLIIRGLETYFVRFKQQCETASKIASYLNDHPQAEVVHYPGNPSHPGYDLAKKQMGHFGAIVSFDLMGGLDKAVQFTDELKLFYSAGSLGSVHSLVVPIRKTFGDDLNEDEIRISGITDGGVRLCIGLEDPEDLINDLENAFNMVGENDQ